MWQQKVDLPRRLFVVERLFTYLFEREVGSHQASDAASYFERSSPSKHRQLLGANKARKKIQIAVMVALR